MQNCEQNTNRADCLPTINAATAKLCIQCTDAGTQRIGSFLAEPQQGIHQAISPIFTSLIDLYIWCGDNGWVQRTAKKTTSKSCSCFEPCPHRVRAACHAWSIHPSRQYSVVRQSRCGG